ncbi:MAG: fumarylacetoacetate hydrolase family protein [Pirellulales bacterium]
MKLAQYSIDGKHCVAAQRGPEVVNLAAVDEDRYGDLANMLFTGELGSPELERAVKQAPVFDPLTAFLLPPIGEPQKILCIGLNYADHARETGQPLPTEPLVFSKLNTALRGSGHQIALPNVSEQVDYEAELVVIIGEDGRNIAEHEALEYVAGYTIGCDVSARDWQKGKPGGQWLLGKSFDGFAPIGPWFVTADDVPDPHQLDISLRLNGQVMQQSNTREMIFKIDELISYISQVCTLTVGDLLFTGTPAGVGAARDPQVFLRSGDGIEVEIEGLGTLRSRFA